MELILQLYIFMLGIVFGSFFNVCIYKDNWGLFPSATTTTTKNKIPSRGDNQMHEEPQ